jgi:hypothetical protein
MQSIDWPNLLAALLQLFVDIVLLSVVSTVLGALILKFFYRNIAFKQLAGLCFWAIFRVLLICVVLYIAARLSNISLPAEVSGLVTLAGMCAAGWLITRDMQRHGVPKRFPGPGLKVVIGLLIVSWVFVGMGFLIYLFL